MPKIWRKDGEEQLELERLFRSKEVNASMKPSFVQDKYDMFKGFSQSTFRNKWKTVKDMFQDRMFYHYPLFCVIFLSILFQLALSLAMNDILNDPSISGINEIDGTSGSSSRGEKRKFEADENEPSPSTSKKMKNESQMPPILIHEFIDPDTKMEKMAVVILLYPGTKELKYDVTNNDGVQQLEVTYEWPELITDVTDIFSDGKMPSYHPKIMGLEEDLKRYKKHVDDKPKGNFIVPFPREIIEDVSSIKQTIKKKENGSTFLIFEFCCIQSGYNTKKLSKTITIE